MVPIKWHQTPDPLCSQLVMHCVSCNSERNQALLMDSEIQTPGWVSGAIDAYTKNLFREALPRRSGFLILGINSWSWRHPQPDSLSWQFLTIEFSLMGSEPTTVAQINLHVIDSCSKPCFHPFLILLSQRIISFCSCVSVPLEPNAEPLSHCHLVQLSLLSLSIYSGLHHIYIY